ncbi:hypothetical protein PR048_028505 [Dryococelus australis]|uniref:Uncharacterized protein n=1 Tax=Dryococelus australis TaxID=614101 RepID=A0ABQ9GAR6_9NEOP|nr:hypothetical protein PR048_028505 [Dryococelus australis]
MCMLPTSSRVHSSGRLADHCSELTTTSTRRQCACYLPVAVCILVADWRTTAQSSQQLAQGDYCLPSGEQHSGTVESSGEDYCLPSGEQHGGTVESSGEDYCLPSGKQHGGTVKSSSEDYCLPSVEQNGGTRLFLTPTALAPWTVGLTSSRTDHPACWFVSQQGLERRGRGGYNAAIERYALWIICGHLYASTTDENGVAPLLQVPAITRGVEILMSAQKSEDGIGATTELPSLPTHSTKSRDSPALNRCCRYCCAGSPAQEYRQEENLFFVNNLTDLGKFCGLTAHYVRSGLERNGRKISEKTRRPASSSGRIPRTKIREQQRRTGKDAGCMPAVGQLLAGLASDCKLSMGHMCFATLYTSKHDDQWLSLRCKLHTEEGLGKEAAIVFVSDPSQDSPGVISGNHGKPKSGWPDRESNPGAPEFESGELPLRHLGHVLFAMPEGWRLHRGGEEGGRPLRQVTWLSQHLPLDGNVLPCRGLRVDKLHSPHRPPPPPPVTEPTSRPPHFRRGLVTKEKETRLKSKLGRHSGGRHALVSSRGELAGYNYHSCLHSPSCAALPRREHNLNPRQCPRSGHLRRRCTRGQSPFRLDYSPSHQSEPGLIPGGAAPGLSHERVVPGDAAGRRVFPRHFPFPPAFAFWRCSRPTLLHLKSHPNLFTHSLAAFIYTVSIHPRRFSHRLYVPLGIGTRGRGKREIPEKTRSPTASSGTIPICENPVTRPGIEPGCLGGSGQLDIYLVVYKQIFCSIFPWMPLAGGVPRRFPVSPRPCIPALVHAHVTSSPSALKTSMLRAAQVSTLHCSIRKPRIRKLTNKRFTLRSALPGPGNGFQGKLGLKFHNTRREMFLLAEGRGASEHRSQSAALLSQQVTKITDSEPDRRPGSSHVVWNACYIITRELWTKLVTAKCQISPPFLLVSTFSCLRALLLLLYVSPSHDRPDIDRNDLYRPHVHAHLPMVATLHHHLLYKAAMACLPNHCTQ